MQMNENLDCRVGNSVFHKKNVQVTRFLPLEHQIFLFDHRKIQLAKKAE